MTDTHRIWRVAFAGMIALLLCSAVAGFLLKDTGMLDVKPPATWQNPNPNPDITLANSLSLYMGTFVGMAAIILLLPVYLFIWSVQKGVIDTTIWLAFWATAFLTYSAYLLIWMLWFFGFDFKAMAGSSRLPSLGWVLGLAGIWAIDLKLALSKVNSFFALVFRALVHLCVLIFFFVEIGMSSELITGKLLGMALLASVITGLTLKLRDITMRKDA